MRIWPLWMATVFLASSAQSAPALDPLIASVDENAAQRFAALWHATAGKPTASQLQTEYLANGGPAIEVFTPNRIVNAQNLAANIAKEPSVYADAVERCLPWVASTNAELRSTYLGLKGLLPERPLPKIAVVIGAGNSGGTAGPDIQVIGLEVICRLSPDQQAFAGWMRQFFAHETVHTFQKELSASALSNPMLAQALLEGGADYVTKLVTARVPDPKRDAWARGREKWIWQQFENDAAIVKSGTNSNGEMTADAQAAFSRWFANAGTQPDGWPSELGYWVGMRICEDYVAKARDPHAAIDELLDLADPAAILAASGYSG